MLTLAAVLACVVGAVVPTAAPAHAHGFSSTVYADVTAVDDVTVRTDLDLEYDLLVVSAAENQHAPELFDAAMAPFEAQADDAELARALSGFAEPVVGYVAGRFQVTTDGRACAPRQVGAMTVHERDGVPYVRLSLDHACPAAQGAHGPGGHVVRSALFPDGEGYVRGTTTIVTYQIDGRSGSAALDAGRPEFSTGQTWSQRFGEFFVLGAEHLLTGIDHVLFLLALIVGSRRLRDIVLAATAFTLAHSITFLLAALGTVHAPGAVVEPVIALSIAVVAAWHLWNLRRRRDVVARLEPERSRALLDGADWLRLGVVFCFGLVHGLGFAGALGIDEPWSWTLLWSLLVFNVGIEVVQLGIIAIVFPLLTLLRRRAPRTGRVAGGVVAAGVAVMGLVWFVQRVLGL
ncbi:HupE/UreJ family protein [Xylanimonas allomyrinae]|uniref:HupE/UreJ family protein n=1 Tax=Xylanimonas allomyrinae TaxID=2509459 RepID=A0A4P6EPA1_9MICO|nr:HupE/UreJ family protein [Xylanimonas allomyrinae]